ncbi:coiled-coil domain-containing protein 39 [Falco rusticolus]|uniref:coiled-coil domain-containing protein 39 n=1 Tax=Falco rusticolus TaxID=120794 RepID=UPI00188659C0|nr:coiled-coil domain-containing protein 39 [Falco rusticolus]XP_055579608.1 coiled-coil domain-containing protein 39 [Falco cherrug]
MGSAGRRPAASVLAELRWDDGYAVPVANAENKALEDELQKVQKEKADLQNELADFEERTKAMASHSKNLRQELSFTQSLYKARENESETEQHFKVLAERQCERLKSEIKQLQDEIVSLREKKNSQENTINKTTKKLENLKQQMNCHEDVLDSWIKESNRKDNDVITIQKYAQQDEGKLGALTLQVEKLTVQANHKRRALDNELTETMTAQIELDKTVEDFRRVHQERQEVIRQWENAVQQMQKRDQQIDHCALLITEIKQEIRKKEIVLKEKNSFLVNETLNNVEYEKKISSAEREATSLQNESQTQDTYRVQLQDQLDALKSTVDRTASDLESLRTQVTNLKKEIQKKQARLSFLNGKNASLSNKLKLVTEETLSSEDKALKMEEILKEEEKIVKEKETEMNQLKELLFKKTQELKVQKDKEKCVLAEIEGSRTSLKNLKSRLHRLDADGLKQQELIYNQDFHIQQVQRRLSRLEGEVNEDEKQVLEAKVAELKKTLEEKKNMYNVLNAQHKKLQSDVHFIKRAMDKTGEETSDVMIKINELNLFNERSDQELKKAKAIKQEMMVEDNLLKLELNRLQDALCNKTEKVLTLEKQKLELKKAIAERTEEIKIHKAMLDSQIRLVDQERQRIRAEFQDRLNKIDKLRCRYEILTVVMMPPEGEEEKTHTYYAIKAAQEKEALQREGDDLNAKICKAEKEIVALENTLCVLNNCNSNYRNSFREVTETNEEYEEKLKLEEEKKAADEKYRYKRRQIKELQENLESMEKDFDVLLKKGALFQEQKKEKAALILQLNKDTEEQKPKLERVIKQCSRLSREIQSLKKTNTETQEGDIDLRELKSFNRTIDKLLADVLEANPDLTTPFQMYFHQSSLELPTITSAGGSQRSQSPSTQSSLASTRSSRSTNSGSGHRPSLTVIDLSLPINTAAEAAAGGSEPPSRASTSSIVNTKKRLK